MVFVVWYRTLEITFRAPSSGLESFEIKLKCWKPRKLELVEILANLQICHSISAKLTRASNVCYLWMYCFPCSERDEPSIDPTFSDFSFIVEKLARGKHLKGLPWRWLCLARTRYENSLAGFAEMMWQMSKSKTTSNFLDFQSCNLILKDLRPDEGALKVISGVR